MTALRRRAKPSLDELNQLATQAAALTAQECKSWHPAKAVRCQLPAGHEGEHRWRAVSGSRAHYWEGGDEF